MAPAIGHLDFYPNGGVEMPGCNKNPLSQIVDLDGIWEGKNIDYITNSEEGQLQNVMTSFRCFVLTFHVCTINDKYPVQ